MQEEPNQVQSMDSAISYSHSDGWTSLCRSLREVFARTKVLPQRWTFCACFNGVGPTVMPIVRAGSCARGALTQNGCQSKSHQPINLGRNSCLGCATVAVMISLSCSRSGLDVLEGVFFPPAVLKKAWTFFYPGRLRLVVSDQTR